jgi:hypothetical protein
VNVLCTSFPLDPRRIARSRTARALVWLLALALVASNIAAAAMPPMPTTAAAATAASHDHCNGADSAGEHAQKPRHGPDCPCCVGKTCACVQLCDALVRVVVPASMAPPTRDFRTSPPRDYVAIEARLLRPPIA